MPSLIAGLASWRWLKLISTSSLLHSSCSLLTYLRNYIQEASITLSSNELPSDAYSPLSALCLCCCSHLSMTGVCEECIRIMCNTSININTIARLTEYFTLTTTSEYIHYKLAKSRIIGLDAQNNYLRLIVNKTSKENLKPRKGDKNILKFLQCNMQKSQHAQVDLNRRISIMNKKQESFICCLQEPCSAKSKLISQPNSVQRFGKKVCPGHAFTLILKPMHGFSKLSLLKTLRQYR